MTAPHASQETICTIKTRTVVGFKVAMKNLCPPLLAITTLNPYAASPSMTSIRVMAVVEGEQDLHEIIPYSVLGDKAVVSLGLLNDGREVATPAEFHENVQNSRIAVYVSVVIAYDMFVIEVLENIAGAETVLVQVVRVATVRHSHFCHDLFAVAF